MRNRYRRDPASAQYRMKILHRIKRMRHMLEYLAQQCDVIRARHLLSKCAVEEAFLRSESVYFAEYNPCIFVRFYRAHPKSALGRDVRERPIAGPDIEKAAALWPAYRTYQLWFSRRPTTMGNTQYRLSRPAYE